MAEPRSLIRAQVRRKKRYDRDNHFDLRVRDVTKRDHSSYPRSAGRDTEALSKFGKEITMTRQEFVEMIHCAGFEAVERDTVYNRVAAG